MRRLFRLGAHSVRQASVSVWHILLNIPTAEWTWRYAGTHRLGVAPGTDTQRKALGLGIDPWPGGPADAWGDALVGAA